MTHKMRKIALSAALLLLQAEPVWAQCKTPRCGLEDPLNGATIPGLVARIIQVVLPLIGALLLVMFLYGGAQYLTAGGNADKAQKAMKTLTNAIIGMAIVIGAYAIVYTLISKLAGSVQPGGAL